MKRIIGFFKSLILLALVMMLLILSPVAFVELGCRSDSTMAPRSPIISDEHHRNLASTYLTYPEWHIVNTYDDYAKVIYEKDPHEFKFLRPIEQFWSSACLLSKTAGRNGGASLATKSTMYIIGVSFTAEILAKAAYEETLGRLYTSLRGPERSALDAESASMARDYATFLQQVPWYEYDFQTDREILADRATDNVRDRERRFALDKEFGIKAAYAKMIAKGVENTGEAKLTIRSIISDLTETELAQIPDVTIIKTHPEGIEIETPRYREFTEILEVISYKGGQIVEIAGNDRVMISIISKLGQPNSLTVLSRQGYDDYRSLFDVSLSELAQRIITLDEDNETQLEHIYDY